MSSGAETRELSATLEGSGELKKICFFFFCELLRFFGFPFLRGFHVCLFFSSAFLVIFCFLLFLALLEALLGKLLVFWF